MSAEDDLEQAVTQAYKAYETARNAVANQLGSMEREDFYEVFSLAEEFGAHHLRQLIESNPAKYGIPSSAEKPDFSFDDLELKLQHYIDANYDLDGAVAELEQRRIEEGWPAKTQTIAFHGEFPVVDLVNQTVTFPGRAPEVLILREGNGPEPLEPEHGPTRPRARGRSR